MHLTAAPVANGACAMRISVLLALLCAISVSGAESLFTWISPELRRLQDESRALAAVVASLPPAPLPRLSERLGYHSGFSSSPDTVEWVEMDLRQEADLDAVVLVPTASDGGGAMVPGYGFPVRFRVEIADSSDLASRVVIADQTREDVVNPGALPFYLPCQGKRARFVRITATKLFRAGDRALFSLGEIMVFHGERNLAAGLSRSDFTASRTQGATPVWGLANLVDGVSVLGPPEGPQPSRTLGYCSTVVNLVRDPHPHPRWVQIDLGAVMPIDEVRLFPAHPPAFAHRPGYGFPPELTVELSDAPDCANAVTLAGFFDGNVSAPTQSMNPGDNVVTYAAHDETARYVRITATRLFDANGLFLFALAELQVWSGSANVALGKPVQASDSLETDGWSRAALVDGCTSTAVIADWPEWLRGLSLRREALQRLAALAVLQGDVTAGYATAAWILLALAVVMTLVILVAINLAQRRRRQRDLEALRERISQDLHDEIGSSLGSIAFICRDALALTADEAVRTELGAIRDTATQTIDSMRDIVRLVHLGRYGDGDVIEHLREIAERMLRGIPHTLQSEGAAAFHHLPMAISRDLVLIVKEVLHNLVRHAHATTVAITLGSDKHTIMIRVQDDGCGFDPSQRTGDGLGLSGMARRAAKHGGSLAIVTSPGSGTAITITLPHHG